MLTISGIGVVDKDEEIKEFYPINGKSVYINFVLITKDPFKKDIRQYNQAYLIVSITQIEQARKIIIPGQGLWIRFGELEGKKFNNKIYMKIKILWNNLEPIKALPGPERKEENNE